MKEYLTEESLGIFLNEYMAKGTWIHNKSFINRNRPDYRNDELKTIVEFDGYLHYTSSKAIVHDEMKDKVYSEHDYTIIRIPYFVQLSKETIKNMFGIKTEHVKTYKHGFIDKKCILPSDFCELGIQKFMCDLERFSYIKEEIIESLKNKVEELKDARLVIPKSLEILIR